MRYRFLRFPDGKTKAVTFSYDDSRRWDIRLSEVITKYGIKGTFNINSTWLGRNAEDEHLTPEEIRQHLLGKGHEIAVHGARHAALGNLRPIDGIREILECRQNLERIFGRIIRGMAYADSGITRMANGASYENIKEYLMDLGLAYARTLGQDNNKFELPCDWHAWMPTVHHKNPKALEYADDFVSMDVNAMYWAARRPRLYYLWGHSYEFEQDHNWELLDALCQKLAHHDDTWYATNMEIYEYVTAYQSLVFSADNKIVYNPTLLHIWFDVDGENCQIGPGETKTVEACPSERDRIV